MKNLITLAFILVHISLIAQVGIGTNDPKGALDITTTNNTGLVLPRVSAIEDVTDGNGNPPVNGTTVFDISRNRTCFYQDNRWLCIGINSSGLPVVIDETPTTTFNPASTSDYIKASNTGAFDFFGISINLSRDGNTLAVGASTEDSNATGINNGNQANNLTNASGVVYVFTRSGTTWIQQAYIKASNTGAGDQFGQSVSLSGDGNTLAVGAFGEASNCLLYTSPSPRDQRGSRMPSSA